MRLMELVKNMNAIKNQCVFGQKYGKLVKNKIFSAKNR